MFKKLVSILCGLFFITGQVYGEESEMDPALYEDLTSYFLTQDEMESLKEALVLTEQLTVTELASSCTNAVIANDSPFMQKWNSMNKEEMTRYVFFVFTNSEIRLHINAILQDKKKLDFYRFVLGYLENDMRLEMLEFDVIRQNASALASLLALDENRIKEYLDEEAYSDFFLYITCGDCLSNSEVEEDL